jgi:acyl-coenzyme A synthetase/AMP-(fatty) acid ligase
MKGPDAPSVPLVARQPTDILFRSSGRTFNAAEFLCHAGQIAADLPDAAHVFNLCQDRYLFAVALAAACLRGQTCLLTSDVAPDRLCALAEKFDTVSSIADDPAVTSPFRHRRITWRAVTDPVHPLVSPNIPANHLAAIVFTSGSAGEPVACKKTWRALVGRSVAGGHRFALDPRKPDSVVGMVTPRHMYGFETTLLLPLHTPCSSWCSPLFYPSDVWSALASVPTPRTLVTTPLQLRALLRADLPAQALERVISATAPLDRALAAEAERRWHTHVFEIFGATEVGSIASRRTITGDAWTTYDGVTLEAMPDGTAWVRASDTPEGRLNDIIELVTANQFRLLGRSTDLVKLGGRRTSLAGLNRILVGIPGVTDGVFVAPDDHDRRPSARMQAFVIAPTRSAEDILEELRGQIDPIFLPRRIVRVNDLPRNEIGKLPREALRVLRTQLGDDH